MLRGGPGNDILAVADTGFADIDGGTGTDTLRLAGAGLTLDLASLPPGEITSIERIDITGTGNNTLTLDKLSIMDLSEERTGGIASLTVNGNAGDTVNIADFGWTLQDTVTSGGISYDRYVRDNAELRVEAGVTVNLTRTVYDLSFLPAAQGFIVQGDAAGDYAGWSVNSAGDVNGDGFEDIIIGAQRGDDGGTDAGEAYVIFGRASGFGTPDAFGSRVIDLTTLSPAQGFVIQGDLAGDQFGLPVSAAGDVNGDGFGDLIAGAQFGDDGGTSAGEAYVIFGSGTGFGTADAAGRRVIDTTSLTASQGFVIQGNITLDFAGVGVAPAGDFNGDGFDDLIVGAQGSDSGGTNSGAAYVVFGSGWGFGAPVTVGGFTRQVVDLTTLSPAQGVEIIGDALDDYAGVSVSGGGDVNGDGYDDVIIGASSGDDGGTSAGEAYVVFGGDAPFGVLSTSTRAVIDLTSLSPAQGFVIQGDEAGDMAGGTVSSAGDVNGDGLDDLLIGASLGGDGGTGAGEVYVVFGSASGVGTVDATGRRVLDLTTLAPSQGFIIQGDAAGDRLGMSVAAAGDLNGDGFDDIIVGAPAGTDAGADAGEAYVIFGAASGLGAVDATGRAVFDLSNIPDGRGFSVRADLAGDRAGMGVGGGGDFNGDGFEDLIVGSPTGDDGGADAGEAYVLFGHSQGRVVVTSGTAGADRLIGTSGNDTLTGGGGADVFRGGPGNDTIVIADLTFADINGGTGSDTLRLSGAGMNLDLATMAPGEITSVERIDLTGSGNNTLVLDRMALLDVSEEYSGGRNILTVTGNAGDGVAIADTGWFLETPVAAGGITYNRYSNGYAELRVQAGVAVTLPAATALDLTRMTPQQGFIIQGDWTNDQAGTSVAFAGDVNGDGFDDVIIGAPGGDDGGANAGEAYVVFGSASGFGVPDGLGRRVIDLTSLSAAQGFIIQGDALADSTGTSVSAAGDVNGDGIADLIVGAWLGDDGGADAGEAYVVFGSRAGFGTPVVTGGFTRQVIDLTTLSPSEGFVIQGDLSGDYAGISVSSAGDVNGDGLDDVIVGAHLGDDGGGSAGEAYVVFGSAAGFGTVDATGRSVIDLTSLSPSQGFIIQGDTVADYAGISVSSAGDVNGDGVDDVVVGAHGGDNGGDTAGEAYVVFGSLTGLGTVDATGRRVVDLTNLTASLGFIIQGDVAGDNAGWSVSAAGDVNGDGVDDIIVGARYGDDGGLNAGEAYVVFGSRTGFGSPVTLGGVSVRVVDLTSLAPSQGFVIQGDVAGDNAGWTVSSAGDFNGDGIDDIIIGARNGDDGGTNAGEAYVVFGSLAGFGTADAAGRRVIDLSTLTTAQGFTIIGDTADDRFGTSVSAAGDVNGDGYDDVIVGAILGDDGTSASGEGYVVFGRPMAALPSSAATAGADMLIGTAGTDTLAGLGGADVLRGGAGNDVLAVADASFRAVDGGSGTDTLRFDGAGVAFDLTAAGPGSVSSIERIDLTGTGNNSISLNRLAVLDISDDRAGTASILTVTGNAGDAVNFTDSGWLYQGGLVSGAATFERYANAGAEVRITGAVSTNIGRVIDMTSFSPSQGFRIQGDLTNDRAGCAVSIAGDVNGDGFDDVVLGAFGADDGGPDSGSAYVIFGSSAGFGTLDAQGRPMIDLTSLSAAQGFVIQGDTAGDWMGYSVAAAGDVNGDGFADLVLGAYRADGGGGDAGDAYVVFGSAAGFGVPVTTAGVTRQVLDLTSLAPSRGFLVRGDVAGDFAGFSVSAAGDVNGDGLGDVVIGAWGGDDGGSTAGEAYIVFGSRGGFGVVGADGRAVLDLTTLSASQGFIVQGDVEADQLGYAVSSAGDINGDGFDDVLLGARYGDDGGVNAGEAYVIFGSASGFGTAVTQDGVSRRVLDLTSLSGAQGFVIQGDRSYDWAGNAVAAAGDVNGDGFDDIIIGARCGDDGGDLSGEAYVIFGSAGGFGTSVTTGGFTRRVIDLTSLPASQGFIIEGEDASDQAGFSVAGAGDVNGDGLDDVLVGAPGNDRSGTYAGAVFVVFGSRQGLGSLDAAGRRTVDLSTLTATQGFTVLGDLANDYVGRSVSAAGDVNGDGYDDIAIGADLNDDGGSNAGAGYIIYGRPLAAAAPVATAGADLLAGGTGNDTLSGGGGADVLRGGSGNDLLRVPDAAFAAIDGGNGTDTLQITGAGVTLALDGRVEGVEIIDITGTGNNVLSITGAAVLTGEYDFLFDFTGSAAARELVVHGDAGDMVNLQGIGSSHAWQLVAGDVGLDGAAGGAYDYWALMAGAHQAAVLAIDADIEVSLLP